MNSNITWALYDAELVRIERDYRIVVFRTEGRVYVLPTADPLGWQIGTVGCLFLRKMPAEHIFREYPDQRLRRLRALDDAGQRRWAWTLIGSSCVLQVKAGVIPGENGTVISADVDILHLDHARVHSIVPLLQLQAYRLREI